MIEVIKKQEVIDSVPARWRIQYPPHIGKGYERHKLITEQLNKLVPPLNADEVNNIIGNKSWTSMECDQCHMEADKLVMMGNDNGEYACDRFCLDCLTTAVMLAKETK